MTDTNQLPEPELGHIQTDKSNQPAFSARQMREAMKHALQARAQVQGEPVYWEWRHLSTHPAPSAPSLIEEAISSGHFGVLPMKATTLMCKAGWAASGGELTFQQIGHIYEEMYKARPLPDDAMLAAKEAK